MKRIIPIIVLLCTTITNTYQYELAICAIFKNEGRFIKEWIEFHKLAGVDHFYLYNHGSSDNAQEVLQPYIDKKEIDYIDWSNHTEKWPAPQVMAYNHCLDMARDQAKWVACLDIDEFLFPVQENNIANFLKNYEECGAVCANWLMFGTSDVEEIPATNLCIELLTKRNSLENQVNKHVKSIVQPKKVKAMAIHSPAAFYEHYYQVTPDKITFTGPFSPSVAVDKIRINHYWTRDRKWLFEYKLDRRQFYGYAAQQALHHASGMNKESDTTIHKYLAPLKKAMNLQ